MSAYDQPRDVAFVPLLLCNIQSSWGDFVKVKVQELLARARSLETNDSHNRVLKVTRHVADTLGRLEREQGNPARVSWVLKYLGRLDDAVVLIERLRTYSSGYIATSAQLAFT